MGRANITTIITRATLSLRPGSIQRKPKDRQQDEQAITGHRAPFCVPEQGYHDEVGEGRQRHGA